MYQRLLLFISLMITTIVLMQLRAMQMQCLIVVELRRMKSQKIASSYLGLGWISVKLKPIWSPPINLEEALQRRLTWPVSNKISFIHWTSLNHKSDQSWVQSGGSDHGFVSMFKSQSLCPSSKVAPLTEHKHDNSWRKSQLILRSNQYPLEKQAS